VLCIKFYVLSEGMLPLYEACQRLRVDKIDRIP
jgi:hypothetical protein